MLQPKSSGLEWLNSTGCTLSMVGAGLAWRTASLKGFCQLHLIYGWGGTFGG